MRRTETRKPSDHLPLHSYFRIKSDLQYILQHFADRPIRANFRKPNSICEWKDVNSISIYTLLPPSLSTPLCGSLSRRVFRDSQPTVVWTVQTLKLANALNWKKFLYCKSVRWSLEQDSSADSGAYDFREALYCTRLLSKLISAFLFFESQILFSLLVTGLCSRICRLEDRLCRGIFTVSGYTPLDYDPKLYRLFMKESLLKEFRLKRISRARERLLMHTNRRRWKYKNYVI